MKKWIIGMVVIVVIVGVIMEAERNKGVPVRAVKAKNGRIRAYVEERARTTLPHVYHLTMPVDGRILPITLKEGDAVQKGRSVARLDEADLKTAVAEAQSRLDAILSEIEVKKYVAIEQTGLKESDGIIKSIAAMVGAARAKVKGSKAKMDYAKSWADSTEQLRGGHAASALDTKKAKTEFAQAQVDYEADNFKLRAMEVIEKISNLLPIYIKQWLERKTLTRDVLDKKRSGAEAALARAKRDLARAVILSPVDGVVLKRHVSNERVLSAGDPLLDLGALGDLEVTADILSEEVVDVKRGDPVDIYGPAIGKKPIRGTVSRINPQGFTKVSSLGVEQQRVAVVIGIHKDDLAQLKTEKKALGVEYRVRVRIYTATKDGAIIVPRTALFRGSQGQWQIFAVRDGRIELIDVEVGLCNDQEVEITSGLSEGDLVVVSPDASLTSGTAVKCEG
ncbi:MAG: HlyD family efflux transporter periplasmic adaptor subunit [Planctomycetes bacterium]|nr:HlyD family efflux transporter periplasmic adaptor subunit [Planctomycetota bacterium]